MFSTFHKRYNYYNDKKKIQFVILIVLLITLYILCEYKNVENKNIC